MRRKVIVVTDGDSIARKTIEIAAKNVGARTISASAGNPTPLTGEQIVKLILQAEHDPVVVMFDDRGHPKKGKGEKALEVVAKHPQIEVIGALAVASNTEVSGIKCDFAITKEGKIISGAVDKNGTPLVNTKNISGDTVDVLEELEIPVIVGIGDIGKMEGKDAYYLGAKITTKALQFILSYGGR